MADMFSEIGSIFSVTAVSDFCNSPIQQLPFSSQYVKQAAKQLVHFYSKLQLSAVSDNCQQVCADITEELQGIITGTSVKLTDLVISYEILRRAIILLIILYSVFSSDKRQNRIEYKTCLSKIDMGELTLGIDLGEAAIAHTS